MDRGRRAVVSKDLAAIHRDDEKVAVRQPTEPGGRVVETKDRLAMAFEVDGGDGLLEEVGVPESIVAPARPLAEVDAADEFLELP